jgi:stage V sporulation protein S
MGKELVTLKVAAGSDCKAVAGSISHALKGDGNVQGKNVEILAIGAGAVNQTVKALAISSTHIAAYGQTLKARFGFKMDVINGEEKTIMRFLVEID